MRPPDPTPTHHLGRLPPHNQTKPVPEVVVSYLLDMLDLCHCTRADKRTTCLKGVVCFVCVCVCGYYRCLFRVASPCCSPELLTQRCFPLVASQHFATELHCAQPILGLHLRVVSAVSLLFFASNANEFNSI